MSELLIPKVLEGKSAIVTGSARGIGRATAEMLAAAGANVLITDLDGDVAEQAAGEIQGNVVSIGGDITADGEPAKIVKKAVDEFGQLDILVNNAGYTWDGPVHKITDEQWDAMLAIHTKAPFQMIRELPRTSVSRPRPSALRARKSSARSSTSPRPAACSATPARPTTAPASSASSV